MTRLDRAYRAAQRHARTCRECCYPIVDEEGNPGYMGEACAAGVVILREYIEAEREELALYRRRDNGEKS